MLSKATTIAAALFMVTSLTLSIMATRGEGYAGSVKKIVPAAGQKGPAPAPAPTPGTVPITVQQGVDGGTPDRRNRALTVAAASEPAAEEVDVESRVCPPAEVAELADALA